MESTFSPKFSAELCMVILSSGPKERCLYQPACDFLFEQCCTPIEVRNPGEALIHSRHAKFSLIIMPEDDHDLIKKIKVPGGLNSQTPLIAVSATEELTASSQELVDNKLVQQVVHMNPDASLFQAELLAAVKQQLFTIRQAEIAASTPSSSMPVTQCTASTTSHLPTALPEIPGIISMPRQYLPNPVPGQMGEYPIMPLQPYSLYPPMVVSYASLAANRMAPSYTPEYMMPRVVNFRNLHDQTFLNLLGQQMSHPDGPNTYQGPGTNLLKDTHGGINNAPPLESPQRNESLTDCNDTGKEVTKGSTESLPGIKKFLEALGPIESDDSAGKEEKVQENMNEKQQTEKKELVEGNEAKIIKLDPEATDTTKSCDIRPLVRNTEAETDHGTEKSPLSVSQTRPYFVTLDEEMERMAFDPKVKAADRHNAKERHRRVRITKAAEFFRDSLPCMNPSMDKATVFHLTVYYLIYLRNTLQQHDPTLLNSLHKTYLQEWESYFNLQQEME